MNKMRWVWVILIIILTLGLVLIISKSSQGFSIKNPLILFGLIFLVSLTILYYVFNRIAHTNTFGGKLLSFILALIIVLVVIFAIHLVSETENIEVTEKSDTSDKPKTEGNDNTKTKNGEETEKSNGEGNNGDEGIKKTDKTDESKKGGGNVDGESKKKKEDSNNAKSKNSWQYLNPTLSGSMWIGGVLLLAVILWFGSKKFMNRKSEITEPEPVIMTLEDRADMCMIDFKMHEEFNKKR